MKKITVMLLAVLLFCVPCMTAFAAPTEQKGATISTTVPAKCEITFISVGGRIEEYSSVVDDHETYDRRTVHTYHIIPEEGKEIAKVLFGGEDVTSQVKDGYFTTPALTTDMTLEVIYKDAGTPVEPVSEPTSKPDTSKPAATRTVSSAPVQPSANTPASTTPSTPSTDTAKTGDTTAAIVFVIAAVTTVSAAFIIVLAKRRKETE